MKGSQHGADGAEFKFPGVWAMRRLTNGLSKRVQNHEHAIALLGDK